MAKELGVWNVDGMLCSMTIAQFREWFAYSELEPFGEERADYRAASICAIIANVNRDRRRKSTPYAVEDFLLRFGDSGPVGGKKTAAQLKAAMEIFVAGYGGGVLRLTKEEAERSGMI